MTRRRRILCAWARAEPAGRLSAQPMATPEAAARQFVKERADLWQLNDQDVATVEVVSVSTQGLPTVRMIQKVDGVEVFQSDMTAAVAPDNRVVSVAGQLFQAAGAEPTRAAARAVTCVGSRAGRASGAGNLSAEEAIARAASDLTGYPYKPSDFKPAAAAAQPTQAPTASTPPKWKTAPAKRASRRSVPRAKRKSGPAAPLFERPVRVKDVLFPMGEGHFVPGYFIELWIRDYPAFSYVVDAVDAPDVLFRKNLTSRVTFKYRVHNTGDALFRPEDGPAPGTPHPTGRPDGFQAPTIPEKLIEIESLLPGRPWLAPNATTTRGNNCIAFADLKSPDGPSRGDVDGKVTAARTFGAKYDHSKPSTTAVNLQNSIVGMFFHVNWLHDRWYEAGFDEASGNAQQDNFGLGGIDGDPILAEGNDFSGTDNANMSTPPDGSSPRMQMFRFDGPNPLPSRTSNHEALITFHEMGHYITNRLVGNGSGLMNVQGGAMGEGWGDFFAICMTSQATDDFAKGVFARRRLDRHHPDLQGQLLLLHPALSLLGRHEQEPADVQAHRRQRHAARRPAAQWRRRQSGSAQRRRDLVLRAMGGVRQPGGGARPRDGRKADAAICRRRAEADAVEPDVPAGAQRHPVGRWRAAARRRAAHLEGLCQARHGQGCGRAGGHLHEPDRCRRELCRPVSPPVAD